MSSLKILTMRDAESTYNSMQVDYAMSQGKDKNFEEEDNRWLNYTHITDAILSPTGVEQCEAAKKVIQQTYPNLKYIFVSPLRRATETGVKSLKDYQGNNGELEWRALPWFREVMLSQCDLGFFSLDYLKDNYFIDSSMLNENRLWFLEYYATELDTENKAQEMKDAYGKDPQVATLIEELKSHYPNMESGRQIHFRVNKTLEYLQEFIKQKAAEGNPVKDEEILLVGHSTVLRYLHGVFDLDGNIIPGKDLYIQNAEIRPYQLNLK